ncbi:uncharacterized [Tachysurus ichikawai]
MKGELASPGLLKGEPQSQQMKDPAPAKASAAVGNVDPYYGAASHCKSKETLRLGCYGNMETVQGFEGSDLLNQFRGDEMGTVERGDDETGMSRNLDMFKDKFVILQFLGFYSNKGLKV